MSLLREVPAGERLAESPCWVADGAAGLGIGEWCRGAFVSGSDGLRGKQQTCVSSKSRDRGDMELNICDERGAQPLATVAT